jgi:hypothetical protein
MVQQVKMRTPEGVEYEVPAALVEYKLTVGWKLFKAKDAPSKAQPIPKPSAKVTFKAPPPVFPEK